MIKIINNKKIDVPADFELVEDFDYVLKVGDKFASGRSNVLQIVHGLSGSTFRTRLGDDEGFVLFKKIENKTNGTTPNLPPIPTGYELVEDLNYVIQKGDKFVNMRLKHMDWVPCGLQSLDKTFGSRKTSTNGNYFLIRANHPPIPAGYRLVTDLKHSLKSGDYYLSPPSIKEWRFLDGSGGSLESNLKYNKDFIAITPIKPPIAAPVSPTGPVAPIGYNIITDDKYVISNQDYYYIPSMWGKSGKFFPIQGNFMQVCGEPISWAKRNYYSDVIIATQGEPPKRFPCDKPYPYGW